MSNAKKRHTIVCQRWLESERGRGCRPDGASLHLTEEDRKEFCAAHWESERERTTDEGNAPDVYEREDGQATQMNVDDHTYERITSTKHGLRLWYAEFIELSRHLSEDH